VERQDQFTEVVSSSTIYTMDLVKPRLFCNPVNKNGEGINYPSTHLACYGIRPFTSLNRNRNQLLLGDQFGELALDARTRPENFCVPTEDITVSPAGAAVASSPALKALPTAEMGEYGLYRTTRTRGTPKFEPREVNLVDQWIDRDVKLVQPTRFGTEARERTTPQTPYVNSDAKLTCYPVRGFGRFEQREVTIRNEFGQERLTVKKPQLLCVPSEELDGEAAN
jgi:hypothetical protein